MTSLHAGRRTYIIAMHFKLCFSTDLVSLPRRWDSDVKSCMDEAAQHLTLIEFDIVELDRVALFMTEFLPPPMRVAPCHSGCCARRKPHFVVFVCCISDCHLSTRWDGGSCHAWQSPVATSCGFYVAECSPLRKGRVASCHVVRRAILLGLDNVVV